MKLKPTTVSIGLTKLKKPLLVMFFGIIGYLFLKSMTMFLLFINIIGIMPERIDTGKNILIVGTDNVKGSKRSDVISIVHINRNLSKIRALSIPRDTRVNIEGVGISKINHAYAYGGIDLLKKTTAEFLSIPIHNHIILNADGLMSIVDELGGISVNIEKPMVYDDFAGNLHINFEPGLNHLTGKSLLKYIRFRNDSEGDIGRIKRQQDVINQVFEKVFNFKTLIISPKLIRIFLASVKSDISFQDASRWLNHFMASKSDLDFDFYTVPGSIRIIKGVSYWRPNIVYLDNLITKTFVDYQFSDQQKALKPEKRFVSKSQIKRVKQQIVLDNQQLIKNETPILVEVLNGNGIAGLASKTARFLKDHNLVITNVDNSESFNYKNTVIVDWKGNLEKSLKIAKLLNVDPANIVVYDRPNKPLDITLVLGLNWSENYVNGLAKK
ncbi:MAG: LCP family protein [Candidatus Margulisiibacteriota bacterium]